MSTVAAEFLGGGHVPSTVECMSSFHTTVSSFGHPYESIEMGNNNPMSSYSDPIADPDEVAPTQQDIMNSESNGHHTVDVGTRNNGDQIVENHTTEMPFLFSTQCLQSMTRYFLPCNIFMNAIYDLFEHKNDKRPENIIPEEEFVHGQPFFSEISVSTSDFANGLPPVNTYRTKGEQSSYAAISKQKNKNKIKE